MTGQITVELVPLPRVELGDEPGFCRLYNQLCRVSCGYAGSYSRVLKLGVQENQFIVHEFWFTNNL